MKTLMVFLLSCLFVSCSSDSNVPEHDGLTIEKVLDFASAENRKLKYSELFDSVSVIPLDTAGGFLLQDAVDVKYELGHIFVRDRGHRIFIFDANGKGLAKIDRKGQGAHEYVHIESFDVSHIDSTVCLFVFPPRLMYFDMKGRFLKERKMDVRGEDFALVGQDKIAVFTDNLNSTVDHRANQLELWDLNAGNSMGFLPGYRWLAGGTMPSFQQRRVFTSTAGSECLLVHPLSNNIYRISDNGVSVKYRIDFGTRNPVPEEKDDFVAPEEVVSYLEKEFPVYGFNSCWENGSWLHISAYSSGKLTDILYDKHRNILFDCAPLNDDMTDAMTFPVKATDDYLVGFANSGDIIGLEEYRQMNGKNVKDNNPVYAKLLDGAQRYENPVVCLYHFKK